MTKKITPKDELIEFLLYTAPGGGVKVEVFLHDENIWLTQKRIAELFAIPSLLSLALAIPILAVLPPLKGRANLWFDFGWGAPFFTDVLALSIMLVAGLAMLWISVVPDLAATAGDLKQLPGWKDFGYAHELGGVGETDPYAYARPSADQMSAEQFLNYSKHRAQPIPLKRPGTLREAGLLALFLASQASAYITGGNFCIDGGMSI